MIQLNPVDTQVKTIVYEIDDLLNIFIVSFYQIL